MSNEEQKYKSMVVTDLDGTLFREDATISDADLSTLEVLGERKILRVIATGRSKFSALRALKNNLPIDFLIFASGAGIIDWQSKNLIASRSLNAEEIAVALKCLLSLNCDFMLHEPIPDNHKFYFHSTGGENPDFTSRIKLYEKFAKPLPSNSLPLKRACQFVVIEPVNAQNSKLEQIRDCLVMLNVFRTTSPLDGTSRWIEIVPKNVSKASAAQQLADRFNIAKQQTLAVGNDYNDFELLNWAATSFVVGNAPAELKKIYRVVSSNRSRGFSQAVKLWLASQNTL